MIAASGPACTTEEAFEQMVLEYQMPLKRMCYMYLHDMSLAEDAVQETFLKVITKLQNGQYSDTGKFSWWLTRIAHNVVIDHFRAQKSSKIVEAPKDNDLSNLRSDAVQNLSRESELNNQQVMEDIKRLVEALPESQRDVVNMRFFQDLSFKEIAEQTNVSINTSLGRMRYALINLRKLTRQYGVSLTVES